MENSTKKAMHLSGAWPIQKYILVKELLKKLLLGIDIPGNPVNYRSGEPYRTAKSLYWN